MAIELMVEGSFEKGGRTYVLARASDPSAKVHVDEGADLDGEPIEPWLEIPRSVAPNGDLRTDLLGFCLRPGSDQARFHPGRRVLLNTDGVTKR
jgi:hypothetical protein